MDPHHDIHELAANGENNREIDNAFYNLPTDGIVSELLIKDVTLQMSCDGVVFVVGCRDETPTAFIVNREAAYELSADGVVHELSIFCPACGGITHGLWCPACDGATHELSADGAIHELSADSAIPELSADGAIFELAANGENDMGVDPAVFLPSSVSLEDPGAIFELAANGENDMDGAIPELSADSAIYELAANGENDMDVDPVVFLPSSFSLKDPDFSLEDLAFSLGDPDFSLGDPALPLSSFFSPENTSTLVTEHDLERVNQEYDLEPFKQEYDLELSKEENTVFYLPPFFRDDDSPALVTQHEFQPLEGPIDRPIVPNRCDVRIDVVNPITIMVTLTNKDNLEWLGGCIVNLGNPYNPFYHTDGMANDPFEFVSF